MNRDAFWLRYMLECLGRAEDCARGGRADFLKSPLKQDAFKRLLQVLSDTGERLHWELREKHSAVSWDALRGLRNILVHESQNVDLDALWDVAEFDLPPLQQALEAMLADEQAAPR